ncbi:MAG: response regulator [Planctomycetota bacterium]|jgi:CheY-like chemotaxis protein
MPAAGAGKGNAALLVDDSKVARLVLGRALESLGFNVSVATNGMEALAHLESNGSVDVVLIDWNMPGMDGPELVRAIRSRTEFAGISLILCSATEETATRSQAREAGSDEYLTKPFTSDELAARLRDLGFAI